MTTRILAGGRGTRPDRGDGRIGIFPGLDERAARVAIDETHGFERRARSVE